MSTHDHRSEIADNLSAPVLGEAIRRQWISVIVSAMMLALPFSLEAFARSLITSVTGNADPNPMMAFALAYLETGRLWSGVFALDTVWWIPATIALAASLLPLISQLHIPFASRLKTRNALAGTTSILAGSAVTFWFLAIPARLLSTGTLASIIPNGVLAAAAFGAGTLAVRLQLEDQIGRAKEQLISARAERDRIARLLPEGAVGRRPPVFHAAMLTGGLAAVLGALTAVAAPLIAVSPWQFGLAFFLSPLLLSATLAAILGANLEPTRKRRLMMLIPAWSFHASVSTFLAMMISIGLGEHALTSAPALIASLVAPLAVMLTLGLTIQLRGTEMIRSMPWLATHAFPWATLHVRLWFARRAVRKARLRFKRAKAELRLRRRGQPVLATL